MDLVICGNKTLCIYEIKILSTHQTKEEEKEEEGGGRGGGRGRKLIILKTRPRLPHGNSLQRTQMEKQKPDSMVRDRADPGPSQT